MSMWVERNGKVWRIREERGPVKTTLATGFRTKSAARAVMVQMKADSLRGRALVPRGGRLLLSDWVAAWRPAWEASLKPTTLQSEGARLDNHILPLLGHYTLEDIDAMVVQRWVAALQRGEGPIGKGKRRKLKPRTVRQCHGLLFYVLAAAVAQRFIGENPCKATTLPAVAHNEMRFLTEPEVARLIVALPEHWRPLVLLLYGTGMRWGEANALRVGDVDLLAKPARATITRARHELADGTFVFTEPKTAQSRRTVTLPAAVVDALLPLVAGRGRAELLFSSPQGAAVRARNFRRAWMVATKKAGLHPLRIHDLRHSHIALLISEGVPLTAVQRRAGHSSIAVTSDMYGHLLPQADAGIISVLDAALALAPPAVDVDAALAEIA